MNKKILSLTVLFVLWGILAVVIGSDVILPGPIAVFQSLLELMTTSTFYISLLMTFFRAHFAFLMSLGLGIVLAFICDRFKGMEDILNVWIKGLQTIPQISYIILLYFWLDVEWCIYMVIILMAFPIAYFNYLEALKAIDDEYREVIQLSSHSWLELVRIVYLPMCHSSFMATLKSALPLSLKVAVMSEVLLYTNIGIGKQLSIAKSNIDMVSVFAWTVALIGLISFEMGILNKIEEKSN